MIKRLLKNILRPHKIPFKIFDKLKHYYDLIRFFYQLKKYDEEKFIKEQNNIFNIYGLDRVDGLKKLAVIKNDIKNIIDISRIEKSSDFRVDGVASEHEVLFSSISVSKKLNVKNILEIGTYDGFNAFVLSRLFKDSIIDTIDLPSSDNDFINYYGREKTVKDFIAARDNILKQNKNINFYEMNSLKLINHNNSYDMIWIDGNHVYPTACIDIINSLNLLNDNGLIVCDDVHLNLDNSISKKSLQMYKSTASYETLNALQNENLIKFNLIYKRLAGKSNCYQKWRKYIGIFNKI